MFTATQTVTIHSLERHMRADDLTVEEVLALTTNDVVQVYSGQGGGACCCGCKGKYTASLAAYKAATDVPAEEVNERMIKKVLTIVQNAAREGRAEFGSNNVSVEVGQRLYIVYPFGR